MTNEAGPGGGSTDRDEAREQQLIMVYAHFGRAYHASNIVEAELVMGALTLDFLTRQAKILQRRGRAAFDQSTFEAEFDGFMRRQQRKSMGEAIERLKKLVDVDRPLEKMLGKAKLICNDLAHHFFRRHAVSFMKSDGRLAMLNELETAERMLDDALRALEAFLDPHRERLAANRSPAMIARMKAYYEENGLDPETLREVE